MTTAIDSTCVTLAERAAKEALANTHDAASFASSSIYPLVAVSAVLSIAQIASAFTTVAVNLSDYLRRH